MTKGIAAPVGHTGRHGRAQRRPGGGAQHLTAEATTVGRAASNVAPVGQANRTPATESALNPTQSPAPPRLAVLGAGHLGPVVSRLAVRAGHQVALATSGDPDGIALITQVLIPGAQPRWAAEAIADADIVVLAMPLHRFLALSPAPFAGKLVIDAMNYWPATDSVLPAMEHGRAGSSELVAGLLPDSAVVKALNHIGYHELEDNARPPGFPDRRAAAVAGDDPKAVAAVAAFVDGIGYDPVRLASLRAGRVLQPGGPVFGAVLARPELERVTRAHALTPAGSIPGR
jgi:predicted dinucleotide-binding enzyme